MKNLVFGAFAFIEDNATSVNITHKSNIVNTYLKCAFVSLKSAKDYNKNDTVALITNQKLPPFYEKLYKDNNIEIIIFPFDEFYFEKKYKWNLAFYKLCALKKVYELNYDNYCMIDLDTYTQSSYSDIWEESRNKILLLDINHSLTNNDNKEFIAELNNFGVENQYLTNYGGEFIATNKENLKKVIDSNDKIYAKMKEMNFETKFGDEFITRITAYNLGTLIKNAGAYIYRFWTGTFYLVSTCYKYNPVCILHCPVEKEKGFIKVYNKLANGKKIKKNKVYSLLHLNRPSIKIRIKGIIKKVLGREQL